jgi:serine/threonine protein kinase
MNEMNEGDVIKYVNHEGLQKQIVLVKEVGKGTYGTVYKGLLEGYGFIAVKLQRSLSRKLFDSILTEIKISKVFSEDYGITVKKVLFNPKTKAKESQFVSISPDVPENSVTTIYPFADGIEVQKLIGLNGKFDVKLTPETAKRYINDLLGCLEELREKGIAHRDIKPANLMLHKGSMKLIDFGFACFYADCTGKKGTLNYLPPEFYYPEDTIEWQKGDVFAIGVVILCLLTNGHVLYDDFFEDRETGQKFFAGKSEDELRNLFVQKIDGQTSQFPLVLKYRDLILGMTDPNPAKRFSLEKCFDMFDSL